MLSNSFNNDSAYFKELPYQIVLNSPHPIRMISILSCNSENLQQILLLSRSKAIILNNLDGINIAERYTKTKRRRRFNKIHSTARRKSIHINQLAPS